MSMSTKLDSTRKLRVLILLVTFCLLAMWVPIFIDKVMGFPEYRSSMMRQRLPNWSREILVYVVPALEATTVFLLIRASTRHYGFLLSFVLMALFTGYIGTALMGNGPLPCSCGSVISGMSWRVHLYFNLLFLLISGCGLFLQWKLHQAVSNGRMEAKQA